MLQFAARLTIFIDTIKRCYIIETKRNAVTGKPSRNLKPKDERIELRDTSNSRKRWCFCA